MDKLKFNEILEQHQVRELDARISGVRCQRPTELCPDCNIIVTGRVLNYIKKISTVEDYWAKRCETCRTTLAKTTEISREFLGLKTDTDK